MCKTKMAVDAAQPSPRRPTTQTTTTTFTTTTTITSSSSEPSTSSSNTSYKLSSTASTSSQTSLASGFRLSLPDNPNLYSLPELRAATNNFLATRLSSCSSSSPSWRVTLRAKDTAVFQRKLRRPTTLPDLTRLLSLLCRCHHTSLVPLLGASLSGDHHIFLVYQHVSDSLSLSSCLRNKTNPSFTVLSSWMSRMQVAADVAQGLDYVHNNTGLGPDVILVHNRVKSSSILVMCNNPDSCHARVCHFGTAQLCGEAPFFRRIKITKDGPEPERAQDMIPGPVTAQVFEGQRGYMSPEFQNSGVATQESDVYAFGVVMLELLSGQEPIKYKFDKSSGDFVRTSIVETAQAAVDGGGLRSWVDRRLKDSFPMEVAEKMTCVALECVQVDANKRPRMGRVAGKISKFYLESRTWSDKFSVPDGISISLAPR